MNADFQENFQIMIGLAFFVLIFLFVRVLISLVNLLTKNYLPEDMPVHKPFVSILIPVRNEEVSLPLLLGDLMNSTWSNSEIIVCNDHSTDRTSDILEQFRKQMPNLRYFKGLEIPEGWTGKNFACHQLAADAKGDYLLFLDADVRVSPHIVRKAVAHIQKHRFQLVSIFPTQSMLTFGELTTVPVMNWVLLSLLPLPLVRNLKFSSLSAANGQFMLFDADNYRKNNWHQKVRKEPVEDILISRMVKDQRGKLATLTGGNDIFCRMYRSSAEAIAGFSRNVHQYYGGSRLVMTGFALTVLFGWIPVIYFLDWAGLKVYLLLVIANRVFVSMTSKQNSLSVFLHPFQMLNFGFIVVRNILQKFKGSAQWKGRKIEV